jgi:hypothetical protein
MQEAEEELGNLPGTALVKELKEANQDRKNVLIKVRLKSKIHNLTLIKINVLFPDICCELGTVKLLNCLQCFWSCKFHVEFRTYRRNR